MHITRHCTGRQTADACEFQVMFQKWISNVPADESLIKLLAEVIEKLELAIGETFKLSQIDASGKYDIVDLGMALGLIRKFQKPIFEKRPDLAGC